MQNSLNIKTLSFLEMLQLTEDLLYEIFPLQNVD